MAPPPEMVFWQNVSASFYASIDDLHIGSDQKVYLTGYWAGNGTIGGHMLNSSVEDIFFAVFDSTGNADLVVQNNSHTNAAGNGIFRDERGHITITGSFTNRIVIGSASFFNPNPNNTNGFVAQYDSLGNPLWAKGLLGPSWVKGKDLAINGAHEIFIGGEFTNDLYYDNDTIDGVGHDLFGMKQSPLGDFRWGRRMGGNGGPSLGSKVALNSYSEVYISGTLAGTADFTTLTLPQINFPHNDAFVAKYDSSGALLWADKAMSPSNNVSYGLNCDPQNNVYLSGTLIDTVRLDTLVLVPSGFDLFWAKLSGTPPINTTVEFFDPASDLSVFPNPTSDILHIRYNGQVSPTQPFQATIYNLQGQLLYQLNDLYQEATMDISDLPDGLYVITVEIGTQVLSRKVVKQ